MSNEIERMAEAYRGYAESNAAERWSLANRGNQAALRERERRTRALLAESGWLPLESRRVLEVGCGAGHELARMLEFGAQPANLAGVDLLADRVALARQTYPDLTFSVANGEHLDFADASFDIVLCITLFSSIKDQPMASHVAREIERVLKPGGGMLWYDFRYDNPRNPNVHGMSETAVRSLFPSFGGRLSAITLLPPLSRRLGPTTSVLYPVLSALPPLRSHLLGMLTKPS